MTTIDVFVDDKLLGSFETHRPIGTAPATHLMDEVVEYLKKEHGLHISSSDGMAPGACLPPAQNPHYAIDITGLGHLKWTWH